jgi:hypothetical protein
MLFWSEDFYWTTYVIKQGEKFATTDNNLMP